MVKKIDTKIMDDFYVYIDKQMIITYRNRFNLFWFFGFHFEPHMNMNGEDEKKSSATTFKYLIEISEFERMIRSVSLISLK